MEPANNRPESTRLATFRSTAHQIGCILRRSTISAAGQVKSQFQRLLKAQEVKGQNGRVQPITSSRSNPLARLPDLCLLALFGQLPLLDQLTARQTCARWSTLMLEVTQTRRTLIILLDPTFTKANYYEYNAPFYKNSPKMFRFYPGTINTLSHLQADDGSPLFPCRRLTAWNWLFMTSLSTTLNQQICTTFSRIKSLVLNIIWLNKSPGNVEHLVSLVEQLGPHLEAFHLYVRSSLMSQPLVDRLYAAINSMSSLLCLNLNLDHHTPLHNLPIISRLEELHFCCKSTTEYHFVEMLQRYGEGNGALRRIEFCEQYRAPLHLGPFTRLSRRLRHCFTYFNYLEVSSGDRKLSLCDLFDSLTSLDVSLHLTRTKLTKLSQLTRLTVLRLALVNFMYWANQDPDDEASLYHPLPQLPSVALLHLQPRFGSHRDLDQLALSWTMPNLQVIYFNFGDSKCTDCQAGFCFSLKPVKYMKKCTRQLFRPLMAQCAQLRLIKHSEEDALGTAEELLA